MLCYHRDVNAQSNSCPPIAESLCRFLSRFISELPCPSQGEGTDVREHVGSQGEGTDVREHVGSQGEGTDVWEHVGICKIKM